MGDSPSTLPERIKTTERVLMESHLLFTVREKLPSLCRLRLETLCGGAEATTVVKVDAYCSVVVKAIRSRLAAEEVAHIKRMNAALPGICPPVVYFEADRGIYATEFAPGKTLERQLRDSVIDVTGIGHFQLVAPCLLALRQLHLATQRRYASSYHDAIVAKRLSKILRSDLTTKNLAAFTDLDIETYYVTAWATGRTQSCSLRTAMSRVLERYSAFLPDVEALVHGDPHLGNIIMEKATPIFIDPRVTWDDTPNPDPGYFDPLYDLACMVHSIFANLILLAPRDLLESVKARRALIANSVRILDTYTRQKTTQAQRVRFITYLICSLSGNLKYSRWTPTTEAFWLTLNFLDLLEDTLDHFRFDEGTITS
ncbi:aminoglycoside phosphotransferase family protein [Pandoraea pulmonicola]|uniref:Phosphotransferase enzyme family n=2 Tax=Pandoraea pulmonicola TaxID=93221 RepID=A0AAJ4ZCS1_PANPU|nr:phosphotransferase [Pandoraea pulmonicola]SUA90895.1 Phosphotransferase enzyme family [Pandoraea pulmonicola]